ncbi:MAG: HDOD domain-containing protein [Halopseudomonas sp.]
MTPQELIDGIDQLVSLPDVVIRVNELIESESASIEDIGSVINHDPALSAQLLKLVNSAFYGFPSQVDSVSRAVNLIGTLELRSLIFASSAAEVFGNISSDLIDMNSFWHRSVYCGLIAKKLASATQRTKGETQFLTGLFHDIGRLILMTQLPTEYEELLEASRARDAKLAILEHEWLGFSSAELGAALLEHWRLPARLWKPVKFQHNPEACDDFVNECHLLNLALQVTNCMEPEVKGGEIEQQLDQLNSIALDDFALELKDLNMIALDTNLEALDVLSIINPGAVSIY